MNRTGNGHMSETKNFHHMTDQQFPQKVLSFILWLSYFSSVSWQCVTSPIVVYKPSTQVCPCLPPSDQNKWLITKLLQPLVAAEVLLIVDEVNLQHKHVWSMQDHWFTGQNKSNLPNSNTFLKASVHFFQIYAPFTSLSCLSQPRVTSILVKFAYMVNLLQTSRLKQA